MNHNPLGLFMYKLLTLHRTYHVMQTLEEKYKKVYKHRERDAHAK